MDNQKLEGSVEKTVIKCYIWRAVGASCEKCKELDGRIFISINDIPDRPHPNCDCYLEEIYSKEIDENSDETETKPPEETNNPTPVQTNNKAPEQINNEKPDQELYEYIAQMEEYLDEIDKMIGDARSLKEDVEAEIDDIEWTISEYSRFESINLDIQRLLKDLKSLITPLETLVKTIGYFKKGWEDTKALENSGIYEGDKYYHAKANAQSAQLGIMGSAIAAGLSDFKEFLDFFYYTIGQGKTIKETIEASMKDQEANKEGRELGREYILTKPADLLKHKRPKGIPKERW